MKPESKTKSIKKADSEKKKSTGKTVQPKQEGAGKSSKTKITSGKPVPVAEKTSNGKTESAKKGSGKAVADKPAAGKAKASKVITGKTTTVKPTAKVKVAKPTEKAFKSRGKKAKVPDVALVSKPVAQEMLTALCKLYPDADCELDFKNSFELLISVILSAQTTDVQVNKATPALFKRFPTAKALAEGDLDEIKDLIKPTGFFNAKATNIQRCAQALVERFNGEVPKTLEELTTLPGAGRKTANVVLGVAFDVPGWTVDTHVQRLSARLGLTKETDPYKIELDLQKTFPNKDWSKYSITLIWHGRRLCYARNPDCAHCPINNLCPSSEV